jgi:hypothetical protein
MSGKARQTLIPACWFFLLTLVAAAQLSAVVVPDPAGVREREFRHPDLDFVNAFKVPVELPPEAASQAAADLAALGVPSERGRLDVRGGRWASITPAQSLVPGRGVGNELTWEGVGQPPPTNEAAFRVAAGQIFRDYLQNNSAPLRIDVGELAGAGHVAAHREGTLVQIHVPRVFNGLPVRGSYLTAAINHGNLVLLGTHNWGDIDVSTQPGISADAALATVQAHVEPFTIIGTWGKNELVLVPLAQGQDLGQVPVGLGYTHRLAWVVRPSFEEGEVARYEGLVDAHSSDLISFEDTAQYATTREVVGGVLPEHNDQTQGPQGTEQPGWPMPYVDVDNAAGTFTGDAGGNILQCLDGAISSTQLDGQYMIMNDNCTGSFNESTTGDVLDLGTSPGTDCSVAPGASPDNTRASRTGFYELNRWKEMARGQLPANSWLQDQLQANMNINQNCNATWNGQVNFYTSGGGCSNTGEIAGVFDHEAGHGMDANDATPGISNPGEGIPDIYAALRLGTSCIGFNFRPGVPCGGYGDPCIAFGGEPACTGVRDINYEKRASQQPHTFTWANTSGTCGSSHCRGAVYAEAGWSLWKRDLPTIYGMDNNTALEITTRLTYIGAGGVGTWFSGSPPFGGCAATSGYKQFLVADDDNGNLNDGTPHMQAIYSAFNRQEIACNDLTVQDSGCAGTPTTAPSVTATASDRGAELSWGAVAGATEYEIYRTDGVFACDFGKIKVGSTAGTSFVDSGMQNGREYYYVVIPKGPSDSCFGPASACTTVTPVAGANLEVDAASAAAAMTTGDGDDFIDNCEDGTVTFDVINIDGPQTNLEIVDIRPSNPGVTINTVLPASITASLDSCATAQGSFDFTAGGLAFGETLEFEVDVTSTELGGVRTGTLVFANSESDLNFIASKTWDFETDLDGWTLIQGTFNQDTSGGGANGSSGYVASSAFLDNQCDQVRSPALRLTATSTMTVWTNFDIEGQGGFPAQWWDQANVAVYDGSRSIVDPDSGRLYNSDGAGATCVTVGGNGWADAANSWASSGWSATALGSAALAGTAIQLDVAYGTDVSVNGKGFWFDQVTVTDVEELVPDAQSDSCTFCGDGTCDPNEDQCSCPADCGTPPANETGLCTDGIDNDCDTLVDCADTADCGTDPACQCDNDGVCETGEDCNSCPNDCISGTTSGASCGNGLCEAGDGEDCVSCPADCNGTQKGKPANRFCCGDGDGQNPLPCSDPACSTGGWSCTDTPQPGDSYCCGDTFCEGDEDVNNCAIDCDTCGNGSCDPNEDQCSCPVDCGTPPANETPSLDCTDGIDNDCNEGIDCADPDCTSDPACQVDCSLITNRKDCNAEAACTWDNRNKVCIDN